MVDIFTPEKRSKIMASIKGKDTKIELLLRRALRKEGIRGYRVNTKLPGKPDIVFTKYRIVIFCDGDFWHGRDFDNWKDRLTLNWKEKIQNNIERDKKNNSLLLRDNWIVLHFWEHEIIENLDSCLTKILKELQVRGKII